MSRNALAKKAREAALSANRLIRALNAYAEAPAEVEGTLRRFVRKELRHLMRCCVRLYLALFIFSKKATPPVAQENRSPRPGADAPASLDTVEAEYETVEAGIK